MGTTAATISGVILDFGAGLAVAGGLIDAGVAKLDGAVAANGELSGAADNGAATELPGLAGGRRLTRR